MHLSIVLLSSLSASPTKDALTIYSMAMHNQLSKSSPVRVIIDSVYRLLKTHVRGISQEGEEVNGKTRQEKEFGILITCQSDSNLIDFSLTYLLILPEGASKLKPRLQ